MSCRLTSGRLSSPNLFAYTLPNSFAGEAALRFGLTGPTLVVNGGEDDLSGKLYVGFTSTDLVIAGEIRDDFLNTTPVIWYRGDEIEVFIDTDLDPAEPEQKTYSEL